MGSCGPVGWSWMKKSEAWMLLAQLRQKRIEKLRRKLRNLKIDMKAMETNHNSDVEGFHEQYGVLNGLIAQGDEHLERMNGENSDLRGQVVKLKREIQDLRVMLSEANLELDKIKKHSVCRATVPESRDHVHVCGLPVSDHTNHICDACGQEWRYSTPASQ